MSTRRIMLYAVVAFGLMAAGCAEVDDEDDAGAGSTTSIVADATTEADATDTGGTSEAADTGETSEPGDTTGGGADADAALAWALDYTGGSGGAAAGEPIKIGVASNASFFPEIEEGAEIAAEFVSEELGGVDGRPIQLETCLVVTAEDGATCGAQFANDDNIVLVVTGSMLAGNEDLFASVAGSKPAYVVDPVTVADYTATDAISYNTAALGAAMGGGLWLSEDVQPARAALVITDDAAGRGAITLLQPVLEDAGIELAPVFVPPTATAPEIESALRSIDPGPDDAILLGLFQQGCIAAYDALANLGIDATTQTVATTYACWGPRMQEHVANTGEPGLLPDGWYFANPLGYKLFGSDLESGLDTYTLAVEAAGAQEKMSVPGLAESFAALMSMTRHLDAVDGDYSFATLDAEIRGFTGPAMLQAGPIACGAPPLFTGVCSTRVSIHRYVDGDWEDVRTGDDLIDISPVVMQEG